MTRVSKRSATEAAPKNWFDVAVIGGGIAGCVSAIHLVRAGLKVILFEKESGPHHKVCGEFLSGEGIPLLKEVGVDVKKLGAAEITGFRLHGPRSSSERRLPFKAFGLSRKVLDEILLERAKAEGVDVRRGVMVNELVEGLDSPSGAILLDTSQGEFRAQRLIVATGKSEFRSANERVGRDSGLVGFKMHLKLKPTMAKKLKKHCDLFVFEHGYGGIAPIEGDLANFCFLIEKSQLKNIGTDWDSLAAHIARHCWMASHYLDGSEPQLRHMVTVANVPYGFVRRDPPPAGIFFVGDQMAVIPSLTGDGMTIAMMTGKRAAEAIIEKVGEKSRLRFAPHASSRYQRAMRSKLRPQVGTGFYMHRFFKNPALVDVAIRAARQIPALLDAVILATRCRLDESRSAALPFSKPRSLETSKA